MVKSGYQQHHAWADDPNCVGKQFSSGQGVTLSRAEAAGLTDQLPGWPSLDQLFQVDELTGAATCTIPLPISPGRAGFTPQLTLQYNSSWGNGPFGMGWRLELPSIEICTHRQAPRYRDADDDTYRIGESELTPALHASGGWVDDRFTLGDYLVQRYRRRYEQQYERIERWLHRPSGQTHWRVIDRDNITSLYGSSDETRVSDPSDPTRVLRWLASEQFDDRGNIMRFGYKHESLEGVDFTNSWESAREQRHDSHGGARYLKRIQYGNSSPHDRFNWHFEVVFDYGDHDQIMPTVNEDMQWSVRADPFSDFRSGFETRIWRLCRRVLMFHRFESLGSSPVLVGSTDLGYREQFKTSVLASLGHTGYINRPSAQSHHRSLPPLMFRYQHLEADGSVGEITDGEVVAAFADERHRAQWIDLEGTGAAGVVSRVGADWNYIRNLGDGAFGVAEVLPTGAHSRVAEDDVIDLAFEETVVKLAHERQYVPLTTLRATADLNQDDPFVDYLDLNGDQADDVVVADDRLIRWYPSQGEDGFADPIVIRLDQHEQMPRRLHADSRQSFYVADMNGDGLLDLVRVREDGITYWPNCRRGRFGAAVAMGNVPVFPSGGAGGRHVIFADLTGTGTSDLIWVNSGEVRVYLNVDGNSFTDPHLFTTPGIGSDASDVFAVDLFGSGMAAIVWLDHATRDRIGYIRPFGSRRPLLLCAVSNNIGCEYHLTYTTPTALWANDRNKAASSWVTTSAVATDVVERVEMLDDVSAMRRVQRFVFRHAHFDENDSKFAGFAYMERSDGDGVPQRLLKVWHHTGATADGRELTSSLTEEYFRDASGTTAWLPGHSLPTGGQTREARYIHRALLGKVLCREEFTIGEAHEHVPFSREEFAWSVHQVQPPRSDRPASYDVRLSQLMSTSHESGAFNPRVEHKIVLDVDEFGSVLREAQVHYGARHPEHLAQGKTYTIVTEYEVANRCDQSTWYRLGVPVAATRWELGGLKAPEAGLFDARYLRSIMDGAPELGYDEKASELPWKRLVAKSRVLYWANDLTRVLDQGMVESKALLAREEELVFDDKMPSSLYSEIDDIDSVLRSQAHLYQREGQWWAARQSRSYDPARFYLVNSETNSFGGVTKFRYDPAALAVIETEDPYGNMTRARLHPRRLQAWLVTDENANIFGTRFDPLGAVLSRSVIGKEGEHTLDMMVTADHEASVHDNPTEVVTYDLDAWRTSGKPVWKRSRRRQTHHIVETDVSDDIEHFDGFGRLVARTQLCRDGKWLVSELIERDIYGEVVRIAAPFTSGEPWPDEIVRKQALQHETSYVRDAVGRVTRTEAPDGTLTSIYYQPWKVVRSDENDLVLESEWYRRRTAAIHGRAGDFGAPEMVKQQYSARAAALTAAHASTPRREYLDARGDVVIVEELLSPDHVITHQFVRDWRGQVSSVVNSDGVVATTVRRDLAGRIVEIQGLDSGCSRYLPVTAGKNLWQRDGAGRIQRFLYDAAGNCSHVYASCDGIGEYLAERTIWGGAAVHTPAAAANNLVGLPVLTLTSAGLHRVVQRDYAGRPVDEVVRGVDSDDEVVDWGKVGTVVHVEQIEALLSLEGSPELDDMSMRITTEYDAFGRVTRKSGFGGSVVSYTYEANGQVRSIEFDPADGSSSRMLVKSVDYDDEGRVSVVLLGNEVTIERSYDTGGNVIDLVAGSADGSSVQDLHMTYDPSGHLMSVVAKGQLISSYMYDSLYRLIKLEGLEPTIGSDDVISFRQFTRNYEQDDLGNITSIQFKSGRMESTACFDLYDYDKSGRLVSGPMGDLYRWDSLGMLKTAQQQRSMRACFGYFRDGGGIRQLIQYIDGNVTQTIRFCSYERTISRLDGDQVFDVNTTIVELDGVPIAVLEHTTSGSVVRYQLTDIDRSVVAELAEDGQIITQQWYLPNGETLHVSGRSPQEVMGKRLGFRGLWQQPGSGLLWGAGSNGGWYLPKLNRPVQPPATSYGLCQG